MDFYFVDYENTHADGFRGIETLEPGSYEVYLFVGREANNLPINICRVLMNKPSCSRLYQAQKTAKNYLDFQLSSFLGFILGQKLAFSDLNEKAETPDRYIIISHDTGYDSVVDYWTEFVQDNRLNVNVTFLRQNSIVPSAEEETAGEGKTAARSTNRRRGRYGRTRRSEVKETLAAQSEMPIAAEENAPVQEAPEAPAAAAEAAFEEVKAEAAPEAAEKSEKNEKPERRDNRRGNRGRGRRSRGQERREDKQAEAAVTAEASVESEAAAQEAPAEAESAVTPAEENAAAAEAAPAEEAPKAEAPQEEHPSGIPGFKAVTVSGGAAVASGIIPEAYTRETVLFREAEVEVALVELKEEEAARIAEAEKAEPQSEAKEEEPAAEVLQEISEDELEQSQAVEVTETEVPAEVEAEAPSEVPAEAPEVSAEENASEAAPERKELKKLPNSYRDKIKTAIKDEKVSFRSYASIYRAVANSKDKLELNNALCRSFKNAQGGRLYNLIKDIFQDYQAKQN